MQLESSSAAKKNKIAAELLSSHILSLRRTAFTQHFSEMIRGLFFLPQPFPTTIVKCLNPNETQYKSPTIASKLNRSQLRGPKEHGAGMKRKVLEKKKKDTPRSSPPPSTPPYFPLPAAGNHDGGRRRRPRRHFVHTNADNSSGSRSPLLRRGAEK